MLKKIDCVMIFAEDLERAVAYYRDVFGLRVNWRQADSVGLRFPETDTEIVLHTKSDIPSRVEVYYLVEDVASAVATLRENGCHILTEPFDITIGKCAIIQDPFGARLCMLDMTKGPLTINADGTVRLED